LDRNEWGEVSEPGQSLSRHLPDWCEDKGIQPIHAQPGRPMQNGHDNGKFRDECLNANWFLNLADALRRIETGGCSTTRKGRTAAWITERRKIMQRPAQNSPAGRPLFPRNRPSRLRSGSMKPGFPNYGW
jgi:putative transposase